VPCIMRWPGRISSGKNLPGAHQRMDFLPTFANLAGRDTSLDRKIDGYDITPIILGNDGAASPYEPSSTIGNTRWRQSGQVGGSFISSPGALTISTRISERRGRCIYASERCGASCESWLQRVETTWAIPPPDAMGRTPSLRTGDESEAAHKLRPATSLHGCLCTATDYRRQAAVLPVWYYPAGGECDERSRCFTFRTEEVE